MGSDRDGEPDPNVRSLFEEHPQIKRWVEKSRVKTDRTQGIRRKDDPSAKQLEALVRQRHECYHCNTIHSASFGEAFDVRDGNYSFELEGGMTSYSFASTEQLLGDELRSLTYASYQIFRVCS